MRHGGMRNAFWPVVRYPKIRGLAAQTLKIEAFASGAY